MSNDKPLRWEVRQRLILIEARLIWSGWLTTQDLRGAFGISRSQASKDIALYEDLAPGNLQYDLRVRRYHASRSFRPRFLHGTSREFLRALRLFDPESDHPLVTLAAETAAVELLELPEREFDVLTLQRVNTAIREGLHCRPRRWCIPGCAGTCVRTVHHTAGLSTCCCPACAVCPWCWMIRR